MTDESTDEFLAQKFQVAVKAANDRYPDLYDNFPNVTPHTFQALRDAFLAGVKWSLLAGPMKDW